MWRGFPGVPGQARRRSDPGISARELLKISGTGTVVSAGGLIGVNAGSEGLATVSGGSWAASFGLRVGSSGSGTLLVNGGTVTNADGYVAFGSGSVGTATVSAGSWTDAGNLIVGEAGVGTLTVTGTGSAGAVTLTLGNAAAGTGTLNLNGGTLTTGQIIEGAGTGTVTFRGGALRLTGNQASLFSTFEAGDVTLAAGGGRSIRMASPSRRPSR